MVYPDFLFMKKVLTSIGVGFLLCLILAKYVEAQISTARIQNQQILLVGAQVYDGLLVQFELEQIPIADRNPMIPALKLLVEAHSSGFIDHSFIGGGRLGSCELPQINESGSDIKKVSKGNILTCIIFKAQTRPVYQFVSKEF
jgi:hypothetical protein